MPNVRVWPAHRLVALVERSVKRPLFGCRMCGQCVLHSAGLVCPMTCPKELRNGPCGGVRPDGGCEVRPEIRCRWVVAYERAGRLPWREELAQLRPPPDSRLVGTSSWLNHLTRRDRERPPGWRGD